MSKRLDRAIKAGITSQGRGGTCLVCGGDFKYCPHSQTDVSKAIEKRKLSAGSQKTQQSVKKQMARAARETAEEICEQSNHPWADQRALEAIADSWNLFADKLEKHGP